MSRSDQSGFSFRRAVVADQERFQDRETGLDFRDVNLQLGRYPPDLVIASAHGWPSLPVSQPISLRYRQPCIQVPQ